MIDRLRHQELVIFVCWVIVAVAGTGFAKLTEDPPLNPLYLDALVPNLAYDIVFIGAIVSLVGLLIAGVPIAVAIAIDAVRHRRWSQLCLLVTPIVAALAWFAITAAIAGIPFSIADDVPKTLMLGVWLGAGFLAVAVSCIALAAAARRSTIDARMYRRAVNPALPCSCRNGWSDRRRHPRGASRSSSGTHTTSSVSAACSQPAPH